MMRSGENKRKWLGHIVFVEKILRVWDQHIEPPLNPSSLFRPVMHLCALLSYYQILDTVLL